MVSAEQKITATALAVLNVICLPVISRMEQILVKFIRVIVSR
ncbi:hypothetical protein ADIARSV_0844 [Arcticibacter svalbardensis MN12-7]|uniref:Uncharacterized protein n=1 Tax=Arcticibacter svalbardensis MN12-7 TaxID=1150600 RepID=R9H439_9SPHI|nr:hypothetical protein ADIARSV_0844 [Arcticibacter svalbardensis MN12-7]